MAFTPASAALLCSALSATFSAALRMRDPRPRARMTALCGVACETMHESLLKLSEMLASVSEMRRNFAGRTQLPAPDQRIRDALSRIIAMDTAPGSMCPTERSP